MSTEEPIIEIKKPILKKSKPVKPKWKQVSAPTREHYLSDREKGSVKVWNDVLRRGLMIFPHTMQFHREISKGFGVCAYDLVAGKVKWRPRIVGKKKRQLGPPKVVYDMIHIDEREVLKLIKALAFIAGLGPRKPEPDLKEERKPDDIEMKIRKFRL